MQHRYLPNGATKILKAGSSESLNSLVFGAGQYLSLSNANFGSYTRSKFAIFLSFRRLKTNSGTNQNFVCKGTGGTGANDEFMFRFNADKMTFRVSDGAGTTGELSTTATYTSLSTKYNVLLHFDGNNATAGDRMRMWINSTSEETSFSADTNPTFTTVPSGSSDIVIGADSSGASPANAVLYEFAFFDNVLPTFASLADASTGALINQQGASGLKSLIRPSRDSAVDDLILTTDWTNNNGVLVATEKRV
jgi:hypothetical protein